MIDLDQLAVAVNQILDRHNVELRDTRLSMVHCAGRLSALEQQVAKLIETVTDATAAMRELSDAVVRGDDGEGEEWKSSL